MIIKREKEYQQLCEAYEAQENRLVILSGRLGVGKTTLIKEFSKGKQTYLYQALDCSGELQRKMLSHSWEQAYSLKPLDMSGQSGIAQTRKIADKDTYLGLFYRACNAQEGKTVIILEDFVRITKNDPQLYSDIVTLMKEEKNVMVILTVSTLTWREEEAKIEPRSFVGQITDRITLEAFSFLDLVKYFPGVSMEDIIQIYALLGGVPGYLKYWDTSKSVKDNVIELFIAPEAKLAEEATHYLKTNLRELALYNTVLCAMTDGVTRLNDMHEITGFSRAKISVYMKNLKQLGVVDKFRTMEIKCHDQEIKGMYGITDPLVHFWYRFLYPNQTLCLNESPENFYEKIVAPELESYTAVYFERVCGQYLELMNLYKKLPIVYSKAGAWYGRDGRIPLLASDQDGNMLLMYSKWSEDRFSKEDLEQILHYLVSAGINPEYYYLFSKSDFEPKLREKASYVKNMRLVDLKDL